MDKATLMFILGMVFSVVVVITREHFVISPQIKRIEGLYDDLKDYISSLDKEINGAAYYCKEYNAKRNYLQYHPPLRYRLRRMECELSEITAKKKVDDRNQKLDELFMQVQNGGVQVNELRTRLDSIYGVDSADKDSENACKCEEEV